MGHFVTVLLQMHSSICAPNVVKINRDLIKLLKNKKGAVFCFSVYSTLITQFSSLQHFFLLRLYYFVFGRRTLKKLELTYVYLLTFVLKTVSIHRFFVLSFIVSCDHARYKIDMIFGLGIQSTPRLENQIPHCCIAGRPVRTKC